MVGNFESGDLSGWESKSFQGETRYTIVKINQSKAIRAESSGSASGLFKKVQINLQETPYLNWSWKVENTLSGLDETTRSGDDYPARIYVVFSSGAFFWKTQALNYVWSANRLKGASWPNAYTANAVMVAVQSGENGLGQWVTHKRNVGEDVRHYLRKDINTVDAVAIMTDTDDSHQSATAYYGNIYFTEK